MKRKWNDEHSDERYIRHSHGVFSGKKIGKKTNDRNSLELWCMSFRHFVCVSVQCSRESKFWIIISVWAVHHLLLIFIVSATCTHARTVTVKYRFIYWILIHLSAYTRRNTATRANDFNFIQPNALSLSVCLSVSLSLSHSLYTCRTNERNQLQLMNFQMHTIFSGVSFMKWFFLCSFALINTSYSLVLGE